MNYPLYLFKLLAVGAMLTFSGMLSAARCQGDDGNWYPYNSPECNTSYSKDVGDTPDEYNQPILRRGRYESSKALKKANDNSIRRLKEGKSVDPCENYRLLEESSSELGTTIPYELTKRCRGY